MLLSFVGIFFMNEKEKSFSASRSGMTYTEPTTASRFLLLEHYAIMRVGGLYDVFFVFA